MIDGVTPNRKTIVIIDVPDTYLKDKNVQIDKKMSEIASAVKHSLTTTQLNSAVSDLSPTNVEFVKDVGWTSASTRKTIDLVFEATGFIGSMAMSALDANVASRNHYRAATDLAGITLGSNQQSSGLTKYQREVGAGGTFASELSADKTAYPPPTVREIQPLKRIAVGSDDLVPTDTIIYGVEAKNVRGYSAFTRVYFSSLAGYDPIKDGSKVATGQYAVTLFAHGLAILHEILVNPSTNARTWTERFSFNWLGTQHGEHINRTLVIFSDAVADGHGGYVGSKIMFQTLANEGDYWITENVSHATDPNDRGRTSTYIVPNAGKWACQPDKFRLDERADCRSVWSVSRALYFQNGNLVCNDVELPFVASDATPFYVQWYGNLPTGATITVRLFDAETGNELTAAGSSGSSVNYGWKGFDLTSGRTSDPAGKNLTRRKYRPIIQYTLPNSSKPIVIRGVKYYRDATWRQIDGSPTVIPTVQGVSITGQDSDPTHETCSFKFADMQGAVSQLDVRAGMAMRVDVNYDTSDPTKITNVFSGYVQKAIADVKGGTPALGLPVNGWKSYDVTCTGEWQRLMEAKTTQTWDFSIDNQTISTTGKPWKVSDAIRTLIADAGYEDENIDVPDIPIRLFPAGNPLETIRIEYMSAIYPVVNHLAMLYLGSWITWDGNATSSSGTPHKMGCWRLLTPARPDSSGHYNILASFKTTPSLAATSGIRPRFRVDYQAMESGTFNETTIHYPTVWVKKRSLTKYVVPPEGNAVLVTGVGLSLAPGIAPLQPLTTTIFNPYAIKFDGAPTTDANGRAMPDTTCPDYTNGRPVWIVVNDGALWSQQAVDFWARRIYDIACHGQKRIRFTAPLIFVTDSQDTKQKHPRILRFGDQVLFNGQQFIVANVNPSWTELQGGSRNQYALYELFTPAQISDFKTAGQL